jgi:hypothetical protein
MEQIPLGTAISALRKQLKTAISQRDEELALEIRDIELELTVEAAASSSDDLGMTVWFLSFDGKSGRNDTARHRLKLTLAPLVPDEQGGMAAAKMSAANPIPPSRSALPRATAQD